MLLDHPNLGEDVWLPVRMCWQVQGYVCVKRARSVEKVSMVDSIVLGFRQLLLTVEL